MDSPACTWRIERVATYAEEGIEMRYIYEYWVRGQHAKGSGVAHGPDTYVMVTIRPEGVKVPGCLVRRNLRLRGIGWKWMGEGYGEYSGPRSALGRAIAAAKELCWWKNYCERAWAEPIR